MGATAAAGGDGRCCGEWGAMPLAAELTAAGMIELVARLVVMGIVVMVSSPDPMLVDKDRKGEFRLPLLLLALLLLLLLLLLS